MSSQVHSDLAHPAVNAIRNLLEQRKDRLFEEVRNYPSPIAACDLQLGYLLEEQNKVSRQLETIDAIARESSQGAQFQAIDELIGSLTWIDNHVRESLKAGLRMRIQSSLGRSST